MVPTGSNGGQLQSPCNAVQPSSGSSPPTSWLCVSAMQPRNGSRSPVKRLWLQSSFCSAYTTRTLHSSALSMSFKLTLELVVAQIELAQCLASDEWLEAATQLVPIHEERLQRWQPQHWHLAN